MKASITILLFSVGIVFKANAQPSKDLLQDLNDAMTPSIPFYVWFLMASVVLFLIWLFYRNTERGKWVLIGTVAVLFLAILAYFKQ